MGLKIERDLSFPENKYTLTECLSYAKMYKTVDVLIVRKEPLSILNRKANVLRFNRCRLFQPMVDDLPNNQKTPILFHSMLDDKGLKLQS